MTKTIGGLVAAVIVFGACGGGEQLSRGAPANVTTPADSSVPGDGESTGKPRQADPASNADAAPDFTVTTFEGQRFRLSELRGTPVVLNFWESWCPNCRAEQPHFNQVAEDYDGKVVFVGVSNNDTVEDGKAYVEEFGVPYAMAHGPEVWDLYDVPYQPVTIVIHADGTVSTRIDGPISYEGLNQIIKQVI